MILEPQFMLCGMLCYVAYVMLCGFMLVVRHSEKSTLYANPYVADNKIEITERMPTRLVVVFQYCDQIVMESPKILQF